MKKQAYPLDLIPLDRAAKEPLHRQLAGHLRRSILAGGLAAGERLPPIRKLALAHRLSRNTVIAAFDQLAAEGFLESRVGAGTFVNPQAAPLAQVAARAERAAHPPLSERGRLMTRQPRVRSVPGLAAFHPGTPETASFPFKTWGRLVKKRLGGTDESLFGYHTLNGLPALRERIAAYLVHARGVVCTADEVVVTTGGQAALDLIARLIIDEGDTVMMEEPGFLGAQSAFLAAGARLSPLTVTERGWDVAACRGRPAKAIYLTPSCQHPLGVKMDRSARLEVLDLARASNAWVIEDDYDGEYNFRGEVIPAIQGLAADGRVIYVGTFAKILFPTLRIGYMVLPKSLAGKMKSALSFTGQYPSLLLQAALSDFIESGAFFQHLNRMRRLYAHRRRCFLSLLHTGAGRWLRPVVGCGGIQIACVADPGFDDCAVAEDARRVGVNLAPLSRYYLHTPRRGFLMGYAGVSCAEMTESFAQLSALLQAGDHCRLRA